MEVEGPISNFLLLICLHSSSTVYFTNVTYDSLSNRENNTNDVNKNIDIGEKWPIKLTNSLSRSPCKKVISNTAYVDPNKSWEDGFSHQCIHNVNLNKSVNSVTFRTYHVFLLYKLKFISTVNKTWLAYSNNYYYMFFFRFIFKEDINNFYYFLRILCRIPGVISRWSVHLTGCPG